jgi:hypothetical protein
MEEKASKSEKENKF